MTWQEVIDHPSLQDLPFKIELTNGGQVVMSPARIPHGGFQIRIGHLLTTLLPHGKAAAESAVETSDNVKVTDVAWFTREHWEIAQHELACSTAPAICVEIASEGNANRELQKKKVLYFEAGAQEVWLCDSLGNVTFHAAEGPLAASRLCPEFPTTV